MKIKTSLYIEKSVWREIKKAAIDAGQAVGDFIVSLFMRWRSDQNADRKSTDQAGSVKNRPD